MFQREVGSGVNRATDYRDLCSKIVGCATSQHVATVAINNGGTGGTFVIGDIVTLTHAGALLDARFEVLTVSAGQILTMRIQDNGAFSNRIASAVVGGAAGSGYAVGDILELQGGTQREKGKVEVATLSGSAVATVTPFETGGAYTVAPSASDTTVGIGPAAFAGDDACTITPTMTGMIGTTGLAVTGGGGTGATVDITLAETGWTVDDRNVNSRTENSLTDEKEVVLVGDATGMTNKPYVAMTTATRTSGIDDRYAISINGMAAHNPALALYLSPLIHPSINTSTGILQRGAYILCPENLSQEIDFWFTIDTFRIMVVTNNNPAAVNTDSGEYMRMHMGLMNSYGTESENPYPMMVGASSALPEIDPTAANQSISGMPECVAPTGQESPWAFYEAENSLWRDITNGNNLAVGGDHFYIAYPFGDLSRLSAITSADKIVDAGPIETFETWATVTRGSPSAKLRPIPGVAPQIFLWPINIIRRAGGTSSNSVEDGPRGEVRGMYFLTATDSSGNQITNFSEDYITIGTDRYRVFHNHLHTQRYQYIAILEDV